MLRPPTLRMTPEKQYILSCFCFAGEINRIYHWCPIQTEKSQPEGKWIMPEMRFTEFPELSADPRVGISQSASETDDRLFFLHIIAKNLP